MGWGERCAQLTELCLNKSWSEWEPTFHCLSTARNTFKKSIFKTKWTIICSVDTGIGFGVEHCHDWHQEVKSYNKGRFLLAVLTCNLCTLAWTAVWCCDMLYCIQIPGWYDLRSDPRKGLDICIFTRSACHKTQQILLWSDDACLCRK